MFESQGLSSNRSCTAKKQHPENFTHWYYKCTKKKVWATSFLSQSWINPWDSETYTHKLNISKQGSHPELYSQHKILEKHLMICFSHSLGNLKLLRYTFQPTCKPQMMTGNFEAVRPVLFHWLNMHKKSVTLHMVNNNKYVFITISIKTTTKLDCPPFKKFMIWHHFYKKVVAI